MPSPRRTDDEKAITRLRAARKHQGPGWHVEVRSTVIVCRRCKAHIPRSLKPAFCPECGDGKPADVAPPSGRLRHGPSARRMETGVCAEWATLPYASAPGHRLLRRLAESEKVPMQALLEKALEAYRRRRFLEQVNDGYAELRRDGAARAALDSELAEWDGAIADGLPPEPSRPARPGRTRSRRRRA